MSAWDDYDAHTCRLIAVALLFTTEPTDRALGGWCGMDWVVTELTELAGVVS